MNSKNKENDKLSRALRELILDASEEELLDALDNSHEALDALAEISKTSAHRALADTNDPNALQDLHRGLGALIRLFRRRDSLTIDELAKRAHVSADELHNIETDPSFEANPRTIYQLERHFRLTPRSLVLLSGIVSVDGHMREEAVKFAAKSESITTLNREEQKLLNEFVKLLREHSDQ